MPPRISHTNWTLLLLYLTGAAAYGGWRGPDFFSQWSAWCLLLPPFVWAAGHAVAQWRRNPYWFSIVTGLMLIMGAVVGLGIQALLFAWVAAESSKQISAEPTVRAGVTAAATAAVLALIARVWKKRPPSGEQ
jgi:hypothetical protein